MRRRSTTLSSIASGLCRLLAVAGLSAVLVGCGSGPPKPADPVAAREALERTLAAWKEGKTPESLKNGDLPIVASDHAWANEHRLIKYRIKPGDRRAGADHSFQVLLWTDETNATNKTAKKGKNKGKDGEEKVEYYVGTNPILTVVRPF